MTRVLFLTESFYPVLGGGERHIRALGAALAASGIATTVVTRRGDASWATEEMVDGIRVLRVPPSGPGRIGKYKMVPAAMRALWRERAAYEVIVVRGTRVLGLPGLVVGRALGKPVVLQAEINGELSGEAYTWGTPLARGVAATLVRWVVAARNLLLRDADAFVAMSNAIRAEFIAAGVAVERIAKIPHGVDTGLYRPASDDDKAALRGRLQLPPEVPIVCYTGRLLRGKGLETLLAAFAAIAPGRSVHLLLVGSGDGQSLSVEEDLPARVRDAGLDARVTFTGQVANVEDYLRASDIFAFPSVFEALGLSLIEASACGLACIGSRTGGIVDVIEDGESGLLVEPGQPQALAAALAALLDDPARRSRLGARARSVAQDRFDFADSVVRYRVLFAEAARGASR